MKRKRIAEVAIIILISPFLIYGFSHFVPGINGFVVKSGSMEPEIQTGSVLFTQNVKPQEVKINDTITYSDGDKFVTHKVVEKKTSEDKLKFVTKGVANEEPDPQPVLGKQIAGKKIVAIPLLGYLLAWFGTTKGFLAVVILPGFLIISFELLKIRNSIAEKE